jgi:hypothetical protein
VDIWADKFSKYLSNAVRTPKKTKKGAPPLDGSQDEPEDEQLEAVDPLDVEPADEVQGEGEGATSVPEAADGGKEDAAGTEDAGF